MSERVYDFIVVGAGTAGCAIAGRLSEAGRHVLLIEAGRDTPPGQEPSCIRNPYPSAHGRPEFFWPSLISDRGPFLQARIMGGGSSINGMLAVRGLPDDYNEWSKNGVEGWAWEDVLPFLRRLECDQDFEGPLHGLNGPVPIRRVSKDLWPPFTSVLTRALARRGLSSIDDLNGCFGDGFGPAPLSATFMQRVSSAMAYLGVEPRRRPNLTILTDATVRNIVINGARATGVTVVNAGGLAVHHARTIVLAAGAIHSPTLLMRSGIGPGEHLGKLGLPVFADRPGVGANLRNHSVLQVAAHLPRRSAQTRGQSEGIQCVARLSSAIAGCPPHDLFMSLINRTAYRPIGSRIGAVGVSIFKPFSVGRVTLATPSATSPPKVQFNFPSDPRDRDRAIAGLRLCCELMADPEVHSARNEVFFPAPELVAQLGRPGPVGDLLSFVAEQGLAGPGWLRRGLLGRSTFDPAGLARDHKALAEIALARTGLTGHPAGTCRMGASSDPMAVLDSRCQVHGVEGLRVIDASIMPSLVRANTNLTVWMIAEKGAAMLLEDMRQSAL